MFRRRMRVGRRGVNWRFVVFTLLVMFVFSSIMTFGYLEDNLRPTFIKIAEAHSKERATNAVNESIAKRIAEMTDYEKLVDLRTGTNGKLTAGSFNMQEAAKIQYSVTKSIQDDLHELEEHELKLPLGLATGNALFSQLGPEIPVKIVPIGHVKSNVGWETHDVGINQTVHILYLEIDVHTSVVVPFATKPSELKTRVPMAYLAMVGDVPQMVFNAKGETVQGKGGGLDGSTVLPPLQLPSVTQPVEGAEEEPQAQP